MLSAKDKIEHFAGQDFTDCSIYFAVFIEFVLISKIAYDLYQEQERQNCDLKEARVSQEHDLEPYSRV